MSSQTLKSRREDSRIDKAKILAAQEFVSAYNDYEKAVQEKGWASKEAKYAFTALRVAERNYKRWSKK